MGIYATNPAVPNLRRRSGFTDRTRRPSTGQMADLDLPGATLFTKVPPKGVARGHEVAHIKNSTLAFFTLLFYTGSFFTSPMGESITAPSGDVNCYSWSKTSGFLDLSHSETSLKNPSV